MKEGVRREITLSDGRMQMPTVARATGETYGEKPPIGGTFLRLACQIIPMADSEESDSTS